MVTRGDCRAIMLLVNDAAGTDYSGEIYDADDTNSADAEMLL